MDQKKGEGVKRIFLLKVGFFFILSLLILGIKAQEMETYKLTGIRKFTYDEKGNKSGKLIFDSLGNLLKSVKYFYDQKGNKVGTEKRLADGSLLVVYKYEYDENGLKVRSKKNELVRQVKSGKVYWNNTIGKCEKTNYYCEEELLKVIHYQYNERGDVREMISCNAHGELIGQYTYKYNYKRDGFEKETYNKENCLIKLSKYLWDERGNKIEFSTFYYSGKRKNSKRLYTLDTEGRQIGAKVYAEVDELNLR